MIGKKLPELDMPVKKRAMLTRAEAEEVMRIEGRARTVTLRTDAAFVKRWKGEKELRRLEDRLQYMGYPISYEKMRALDWCPIGLRVLSLLAIKDTFNWGDEEIRSMGYTAPIYSFVARLFMKAITSPKLAIRPAPVYWTTHYDVGKVEVEFQGEEHATLFIREFSGHPVLCRHVEGYIERVIQFVLPHRKVSAVETRCVFKGDTHHQYDLVW
jgi:hypothetical protein